MSTALNTDKRKRQVMRMPNVFAALGLSSSWGDSMLPPREPMVVGSSLAIGISREPWQWVAVRVPLQVAG